MGTREPCHAKRVKISFKNKIVIPITSKASNKVHSGVKFSKFGNAVWFLLFVIGGDLYLQLIFEKYIIIIDLERWVSYNEKQHTYFWGQLFNF